jgi:1,4-dihydroxy-2-naphthoate octaprenyltransferase
VVGGIALGFPSAVATIAFLATGALYSGPPWYLKGRPVGATIAGGGLGLFTYIAGVGAGTTSVGTAWGVLVVTMTLWMALVGVPAKDLSDVAGDLSAGRRTSRSFSR